MRIALVNLPVHIPTVMPYSLAMMKAVLDSELDEDITAIDLNAKFHFEDFNKFYLRKDKEDYFRVLKEFVNETRHKYPLISKACVEDRLPPGHDALMALILDLKPDIVAFSLTYNSQSFFAKGIISELQKNKIRVIIGGPADYSKIRGDALVLPDYAALIRNLVENGARTKKMPGKPVQDYSFFNKEEYFTKEMIYTQRTAISCPYRRCAFCTHHGNKPYEAISLNFVKETIIHNKMKKVCFIDDDFPAVHLERLAEMVKPLGIEWWCQLRPVKANIRLLPKLSESGLKCVAWGVESGSQRVLDFMEKGTIVENVEKVLAASKAERIRNITYIMFGYPSETKEDFRLTVEFLKRNSKNIDLVSQSVFGLQRGSRMYDEPGRFGIKKISYSERTMLDDKVMYDPASGISQDEAEELKRKCQGEINRINKVPKIINSCKEQMLNL